MDDPSTVPRVNFKPTYLSKKHTMVVWDAERFS